MKRNGFLTLYMLWLGAVVLAISLSASSLANAYIRSARQYCTAVQLEYAAESMVLVGWDEMARRPWQDVPARKNWEADDPYGIVFPGQRLEMQCVSSPYQLPFNGFLRASVISDSLQLRRTCGIQFTVQADEEGHTQYVIRQVTY
ncbi:hypothetical protein [uncultured Megasphaera sp.]|uniref:hypothetical protein n=1 Tax=uncultured Megasphaera sp. TaxID=165188 RepID=UPI002657E1F5|nr:hypothetical protein [uncultured Megasphaera sp.]